eukprot:TRINITY_DN24438_c0_g1_i1.p1 TRINITY_DN24438_c0_g1~~TRINITY_DN24438_c0_g1_i1.p1  ORF type:complete len:385 (+),score=51.78 TRINITY_DN24438_c0_g1_i1:182-1336(+)
MWTCLPVPVGGMNASFLAATSFKCEAANVIETLRSALARDTYGFSIELVQGSPHEMTLLLLGFDVDEACVKYVREIAQTALLRAAEASALVHVLGDPVQPFEEKPDGFHVILGSVEYGPNLCWDFCALGGCARGDSCTWVHPSSAFRLKLVVEQTEEEKDTVDCLMSLLLSPALESTSTESGRQPSLLELLDLPEARPSPPVETERGSRLRQRSKGEASCSSCSTGLPSHDSDSNSCGPNSIAVSSSHDEPAPEQQKPDVPERRWVQRCLAATEKKTRQRGMEGRAETSKSKARSRRYVPRDFRTPAPAEAGVEKSQQTPPPDARLLPMYIVACLVAMVAAWLVGSRWLGAVLRGCLAAWAVVSDKSPWKAWWTCERAASKAET